MTRTRLCLCISLFLMFCGLTMLAQSVANTDSVVPGMIKFTGTLTDLDHKPLTGTVGVTFLLYKEQTGGAPLWMETQNVEADKNGHYSILLGSASAHGIPADAFVAGEARWLGVQPSGQSEQARVMLASVPYAMKAHDAETINGLPASAFVLASPAASGAPSSTATSVSGSVPPAATITGTGTAGFLPDFTGAATIGNSAVFQAGAAPSAKVGINTTTPSAALDVAGTTNLRGSLTLPSVGTATTTAGKNSQPMDMKASAFNTTVGSAVQQTFQLQAEPISNDTGNASATLNLLFATGANAPAETGFKISKAGIVSFAPGQTFPGTSVSVGLTAPSSDFTVSGSPVKGNGTLALQWITSPTPADVANAIVKRDGSGNFSTTELDAITINATGSVNAPGFVAGNNGFQATATGEGVGSVMTANLSNTPAISGRALATGDGTTRGVQGITSTNQGIGVFGLGQGTASAGVFGEATNGGFGVLGHSDGPGNGVWGETFGSSGDGVVGVAHNGGDGVFAFNDNSGDALFALNQTNGAFAAFFNGNVDVDGNLSKAAGSFKIDHPLDPANKYLYHSFVESPDMMNVYNGNVTTDGAGRAIVDMPDWFEALNRDFRYQLTVIGQFAQAMVASEIAGHKFTIQTDKPNVKVSWQVTGIRQDAWANAHRIPVELEKSDKERGFYLHPELFGAPEDKSIVALRHPEAMKIVKASKAKMKQPQP
jgi:trimeric autotransporter adhesin